MNIRLNKRFTLKINGFVFLLSLLVFASLIKLGFWQLDRAKQKEHRLQNIALYQQQEAMKLDDIISLQVSEKNQSPSIETSIESINDLPVELHGTFINQPSFLLDNQVYKGRLGYRVIKPFQDRHSHTKVLVNLGWIPGKVDRAYIPDIEDIIGQVSFKGMVRLPEPSLVLSEDQNTPGAGPIRIQTIDIKKIRDRVDFPLLPFIIYVDNEDPLGYIKEWVPIVMSPDKHRGYAFQWFSLALAWVILMLAVAFKSASKPES